MMLCAIQRRCPWTEQMQNTRCDLLQLKTWIQLRHLGSCLNKDSVIRVVKHNRFKGSKPAVPRAHQPVTTVAV
jgi:hypothetical protein